MVVLFKPRAAALHMPGTPGSGLSVTRMDRSVGPGNLREESRSAFPATLALKHFLHFKWRRLGQEWRRPC